MLLLAGGIKEATPPAGEKTIMMTVDSDNSDCSTTLSEALVDSDDGEEDDSARRRTYNDKIFANRVLLDDRPLPPPELPSIAAQHSHHDSVEELKRKVQMLQHCKLKLARELKELRDQQASGRGAAAASTTSTTSQQRPHTAASSNAAGARAAVNTNLQSRNMIGSGHIADYLYKWRNLYRFSQQGWDVMNSLVKTFFFRRTSHGGGVRGNSKSRLTPIARWLQRRFIFIYRMSTTFVNLLSRIHCQRTSVRKRCRNTMMFTTSSFVNVK